MLGLTFLSIDRAVSKTAEQAKTNRQHPGDYIELLILPRNWNGKGVILCRFLECSIIIFI